jgi:hypothetical protein
VGETGRDYQISMRGPNKRVHTGLEGTMRVKNTRLNVTNQEHQKKYLRDVAPVYLGMFLNPSFPTIVAQGITPRERSGGQES